MTHPEATKAASDGEAIELSSVVSPWHDPFRNLAIEQVLLDRATPGSCTMYLWRNADTIVVGKNQDVWRECRVEAFERDGGTIARRRSGGGAVYHDLGNLNFTFVACDDVYDVARQVEVIRRAVSSFGIDAQSTGRNDIVVGDVKFSGNAFYSSGTKRVHHGTIMVDVDTARLSDYLNPDPRKLAAKGVASVRSRVVNLSELSDSISVDALIPALQSAFEEVYGASPRKFSASELDSAELEIAQAQFADRAWRLRSPAPFTHRMDGRFAWGGIDLKLVVENGAVTSAEAFGDAIDESFADELAAAATGAPYSSEGLIGAIAPLGEGEGPRASMVRDCLGLVRRQFDSEPPSVRQDQERD